VDLERAPVRPVAADDEQLVDPVLLEERDDLVEVEASTGGAERGAALVVQGLDVPARAEV
jgi:hypothetical protein